MRRLVKSNRGIGVFFFAEFKKVNYGAGFRRATPDFAFGIYHIIRIMSYTAGPNGFLRVRSVRPVEIEEKGKRQLLRAKGLTRNSKERRQMEKGKGIDTSVTFSASRYRRNRPVKWLMFSSFWADASAPLESVLYYFELESKAIPTGRDTGQSGLKPHPSSIIFQWR